MSDNVSSIKISGLIQNMLDSGFSNRDCIGEGLDNARKAKATCIRIVLNKKTNTLYFIDDGHGMNEATLTQSCILHDRKKASADGQGCFGIGGNHMMVQFTQHQFATTTISRSQETGELFEIKADWKKAVEENYYHPVSHEITMKNSEVWNKYAFDPENSGTIHVIPCEEGVFQDLVYIFTTTDYEHDLVHDIGKKYYRAIDAGLQIELVVDDSVRIVESIDPLSWKQHTNEKRKQDITVSIYQHIVTKEIRAYYKDRTNATGRVEFGLKQKNGRAKPPTFKREAIPPNYALLDTIRIRSVFSKEWDVIQKKNFPSWKDMKKELLAFMNGYYMMRQDKVINRFGIPKPKSGDTAQYDYITDTRHLIEFQESLDKLFHVMINKSEMKEDLIHKTIWATIQFVCESFSKTLYKIENPKKDDSDESSVASVPKPKKDTRPIASAPAPAPSPAPIEDVSDVSDTESTSSEIPPNILLDIFEAAARDATAPVAPAPPPVSTKVLVKSSVRNTSKSHQDILQSLILLKQKLTSIVIQEKINTSSPLAESGLTDIYTSIEKINKYIDSLV